MEGKVTNGCEGSKASAAGGRQAESCAAGRPGLTPSEVKMDCFHWRGTLRRDRLDPFNAEARRRGGKGKREAGGL